MIDEEVISELEALQAAKNQDRGVDCVRTLITYLRKGNFYSAHLCAKNEWDKISSYTDIANFLIKVGLYTPIKFN